MTDDNLNLSDLINREYILTITCAGASYYQDLDGVAQCLGPSTLSPEEFVMRFGDRKLSQLEKEYCPYCGSSDVDIEIHQKSMISVPESEHHAERITTDTLISFATLALIALLLFSLSGLLPREGLFILTASILISATILIALLALFVFVPRIRHAIVYFERNAKEVTISFLAICLILAMLAFAIFVLT